MNKENKPVELNDEELENVNSGMKIIVTNKPKFIQTIIDLILKIKNKTKSDIPASKDDDNTLE